MRLSTSLLLGLFSKNQPYDVARKMRGDLLLEIYESLLDESLVSLEPDQARRAREDVRLTKAYGSVAEYVRQELAKRKEKPPSSDILTA